MKANRIGETMFNGPSAGKDGTESPEQINNEYMQNMGCRMAVIKLSSVNSGPKRIFPLR